MTTAKEPAIQENLRADNKSVSPEIAGRPSFDTGVNGRKPRFLARFRREREDGLDITGYVVDGLNTPKPVIIKTGATILGHVVAPKVVVEGTVLGSAYGREIEVASGGHISGDVFAISVRVQPGGKIQGWVSSIDEADFERFRTTGTLIDEVRLASQVENLGEKIDASVLTRNESDMESLHLLQLELAASLAARYEMEQDFEKRLAEMAGEAFGKINTLTEQLTAVRGELTGQKRRLDETQETIRQQKTQIDRQMNELSLGRDLMTDQNQELGQLRDLYNDLRHRHQMLQTEKAEEDDVLQTAVTEKETLTKRLVSLETAHRNNLQYQADQEDSLLRWQELAEMTERKAAELETQLQRAQFQMEESSTTINLLREQRRELDAELERALADLRELQGNKTRPLADPEVLIEATDRIAQLEAELADAEQEYLEQTIWYKASLETSRSELEKAREATREAAISQSAELQKMQGELAGLQTEMNQQHEQMAALQKETAVHRQEATRWQAAVAEKETQWRQQSDELKQNIVMLTADKKNMQATLRESQLQLSATESEVNRYLQETRSQGERLAEIHARLVEREIQLKQVIGQLRQAREMVEKQNQAIKQMKEMAGGKIRALQVENVRLKSVVGNR